MSLSLSLSLMQHQALPDVMKKNHVLKNEYSR
jgi:hypothetical protein